LATFNIKKINSDSLYAFKQGVIKGALKTQNGGTSNLATRQMYFSRPKKGR
jgi:hypothetical protein